MYFVIKHFIDNTGICVWLRAGTAMSEGARYHIRVKGVSHPPKVIAENQNDDNAIS